MLELIPVLIKVFILKYLVGRGRRLQPLELVDHLELFEFALEHVNFELFFGGKVTGVLRIVVDDNLVVMVFSDAVFHG